MRSKQCIDLSLVHTVSATKKMEKMGIMATGGGVYTVMAMATKGIEFFSPFHCHCHYSVNKPLHREKMWQRSKVLQGMGIPTQKRPPPLYMHIRTQKGCNSGLHVLPCVYRILEPEQPINFTETLSNCSYYSIFIIKSEKVILLTFFPYVNTRKNLNVRRKSKK